MLELNGDSGDVSDQDGQETIQVLNPNIYLRRKVRTNKHLVHDIKSANNEQNYRRMQHPNSQPQHIFIIYYSLRILYSLIIIYLLFIIYNLSLLFIIYYCLLQFIIYYVAIIVYNLLFIIYYSTEQTELNWIGSQRHQEKYQLREEERAHCHHDDS